MTQINASKLEELKAARKAADAAYDAYVTAEAAAKLKRLQGDK